MKPKLKLSPLKWGDRYWWASLGSGGWTASSPSLPLLSFLPPLANEQCPREFIPGKALIHADSESQWER